MNSTFRADQLIQPFHLCAADGGLQIGHPVIESNLIVSIAGAGFRRRRDMAARFDQKFCTAINAAAAGIATNSTILIAHSNVCE